MKQETVSCPDPSHKSALLTLFERGETDFRICPECGLAFRARFPSLEELDAIYASAYERERIVENATEQESGDYAAEAYGRFLRARVLPGSLRVLDFGAGTGALTSVLRHYGIEAQGVEFSADARSYCLAERGFALSSDLSTFASDSFDVITMIEVIEHLTDLRSVLVHLWSVLRPGGVLFVTTPNRRSWRALIEDGNWREARKKFHLFLFDDRSIRHHLFASGFEGVQRVWFSPVTRPGLAPWAVCRITQAMRLGGTLCFLARKPGG